MRWLSEKRLATWLNNAHYTRANTRTPAQLLDHLNHAPAGHPDGPAAADAAETVTLELVALLPSLRERITTLENHIEHALAAHPDQAVFTSLPRSGRVRAATLLAEIGDARGRYPTDDALAATAGIPPPPAPRAAPATSPSAAPATTGYAKPSSTAAAPPTPGPKTSTPAPEHVGSTTPTPYGSWPEPGCASSGAAGSTAPPDRT